MKIFFDTNVYVAEALLGQAAEEMIQATVRAAWRIYVNVHVLGECERVLTEKLRFSRRLAILTRARIRRRAKLIDVPASHHSVPDDPADSPILRSAIAAGSDYLVSNDPHLLTLNPYQGLRIVSMTEYHQLLVNERLLSEGV